jgi:D-lactate dehydrogenase
MNRVLVTEADDTLETLISRALPNATITQQIGLLDVESLQNANEIEAICVTVRSPVGQREMDALPNLCIIATGSAGFDHIDTKCADEKGITVCNVPRYGPAVAEFNIALMLALTRKVHIAYLNTLQRDFALEGLKGRNLFGKTLGVVGAGNIGASVARMAAAFGMKVIACDPFPNRDLGIPFVTLYDLLSNSEIIAICCPLTEDTRHLIGKDEFRKMRPGVLIVNTSRGAVMDTHALMWALDQGIVAGAALDVLEGEALLSIDSLQKTLSGNASHEDTKSIAEDLTLMRHPRVLVTPHLAYFTEDSLMAIMEQTAANLLLFVSGEPQNVVNNPAVTAAR